MGFTIAGERRIDGQLDIFIIDPLLLSSIKPNAKHNSDKKSHCYIFNLKEAQENLNPLFRSTTRDFSC